MDTAYNINNIGNLYNQPRFYGNTVNPQHEDPHKHTSEPEDRVTFSKAALAKNSQKRQSSTLLSKDSDASPEEKQIINNLKRRDTEVKAHEAAHLAAGSGIVQGGATYQYESGPDGKMYAVGGEVQIDVSPESTPEATIQKMQQVRAAALAPADPSGTDRAVAAQASQLEAQARMEKMMEKQEERENEKKDSRDAGPADPMQGIDRLSPPGSRIDFMA